MDDHHRKCKTLFFAGTDTDVGKTFVASLVAEGLRQRGLAVGVYKPVASGCQTLDGSRVADDASRLWRAAGKPRSLDEVCPQRFEAALAPPEAAAAEGQTVDADRLRDGADIWRSGSDVLIVEGAGGLFSPLADETLNIDLAIQLSPLDLVIVAEDRLGAIHQTLATCEAAIGRGIPPAGVLLCRTQSRAGEAIETNRQQIERYSSVPVLGVVEFGATEIDPRVLTTLTN